MRDAGLFLLLVTVATLIFCLVLPSSSTSSRGSTKQLPGETTLSFQVHKTYAPTFGGANTIMLMLEVEEGTIFNQATLTKIFQYDPGVGAGVWRE